MTKDEVTFKPNELRQAIFAALGISIVLGGSVVLTPNFPIVLGTLIKLIDELKGVKVPKTKLKRTLKTLEKRKILALDQQGDEVIVKVTDLYNTEIFKYSIKKLLDLKKQTKKWNKKWFMVAFDVPEKEKNKREFLRKFLRQIGFYQYQKSLYVFPYECEEETHLIKKIVEGGKYINYLVVDRLDKEFALKSNFQLT